MKFDDLVSGGEVPATADGMLTAATNMISVEDITANEKGGYATGFLMGLTYALAKHNEGDIPGAARTLLRLQREWEANGVFG